jgi:hypothetical protein
VTSIFSKDVVETALYQKLSRFPTRNACADAESSRLEARMTEVASCCQHSSMKFQLRCAGCVPEA